LSLIGQVAILGAASAHPSLSLWTSNRLEFPHPIRLVLISGSVWLVSFALSALAFRLGATRWAATGGGVVWALTIGMGGAMAGRVGLNMTLAGGAALGALVVVLMNRLAENMAAQFPLVILAFVLGVGPIGPYAVDVFGHTSPTTLQSPQTDFTTTLDVRPDIYVIVVDGFVGIDGSREVFAQAVPPWVEELRGQGFEVPASGWASYPITIASIPSLFDMDYSIEAGVNGDRAVISALLDKLGGANRLVSTLNVNGYHTVMVEAGWSWSHCGPAYDECVASAFLDEGTFAVVRRSIVGPMVVDRMAHPFTVGAKHAMDWLLRDARADRTGSEPRFVFGHVMAPHPPFFLTDDCSVENEMERAGGRLDNRFTDLSRRKDLYLNQAECVADFIVEFAVATDPNDVVVVISDHGSDSRDQLLRPGSQWTLDDIYERLSVLMAVRTPSDCDLGDTVVIPDLMRAVLACLGHGAAPTPPIEPRMFSGTLRLDGEPNHLEELEPGEVDSILSATMDG